jgi:hypothetical protein
MPKYEIILLETRKFITYIDADSEDEANSIADTIVDPKSDVNKKTIFEDNEYYELEVNGVHEMGVGLVEKSDCWNLTKDYLKKQEENK